MKKFLILALTLIAGVASADVMALRNLNIGDPYPQFCGEQLDGKKVCTSDYKDKVLVLAFVRMGQSQSKKVMLALQELYTEFDGKNVNVSIVGVVSGEIDLQELIDFRKNNKLTVPVFVDKDREIYSKFGVFVYPSTIVIGQDEKLHYLFGSAMINYKRRLEGSIRFLLKEITAEEFDKILHPVVIHADTKFARMERYYNGARKSFENQQFSKAKKLVKISLKKYPEHALSLSLYGYILIRDKEYKEALEQFEKALQLNPDLEEAQVGKQICLEKDKS